MGEPHAAAVARAAAGLAGCARWLRTDARTVAVVSRGEHPLWRDLVARLRDAGTKARWTVLDEFDNRWAPANALAGADRPDLLVHHDPFLPGAPAPRGSAQLRGLLADGIACVFVDFPHGIRTPRLATRLDEIYLAALATEPATTVHRARRLARRLAAATALEIAGGNGTLLRVDPPWQVRHDFSSARADAPVLQLPLGELWLAVPPAQVDGEVAVGPDSERVRIRAGHVDSGGPTGTALGGLGAVEIGFGTNPAARWIAGTNLCEKADGAVHVGFGDSSLIGGGVVADEHVDVYLTPDCVVWTVDDDDRARVRAF
jgi:hypothetical protein